MIKIFHVFCSFYFYCIIFYDKLKHMIESNEIFLDFDPRIALWCDSVGDTNDLASLANYIIENKINLISVSSEIVSFIWTCLEKTNVKITTKILLC